MTGADRTGAPTDAGRNLVLVGLMGAGKTTVGRLLAARLGRSLIDTDVVVEQEAGVKVAEIFATQGEGYFRLREAAAIARLAEAHGLVVSVGGGAVMDPDNVRQLRAGGAVIWLDADPRALARRMRVGAVRSRPLLGEDPAARLLELDRIRRRAYADAAHHVVRATGRSPAAVAAVVAAWARRQPGLLTEAERARSGSVT